MSVGVNTLMQRMMEQMMAGGIGGMNLGGGGPEEGTSTIEFSSTGARWTQGSSEPPLAVEAAEPAEEDTSSTAHTAAGGGHGGGRHGGGGGDEDLRRALRASQQEAAADDARRAAGAATAASGGDPRMQRGGLVGPVGGDRAPTNAGREDLDAARRCASHRQRQMQRRR